MHKEMQSFELFDQIYLIKLKSLNAEYQGFFKIVLQSELLDVVMIKRQCHETVG